LSIRAFKVNSPSTLKRKVYMQEEWRLINNTEFPKYEVSDMGGIRNLDKKFISTIITENGYLRVKLRKGRKAKNFFVHILVAEAFLKKDNVRNTVRHMNDMKTDNRVVNLRFIK